MSLLQPTTNNSLDHTRPSLHTLLHGAVGMQATQSTIAALVYSYPDACLMQDVEGKAPLHLACDRSCKLFENSTLAIRTPRFEMIHANPGLEQLVDQDSRSPLEYAMVLDLNFYNSPLVYKVKNCICGQKETMKVDIIYKNNKCKRSFTNRIGNYLPCCYQSLLGLFE